MDLRSAFLRGNSIDGMCVVKNGSPLSFEDVASLTVGDLPHCTLSVHGEPLAVRVDEFSYGKPFATSEWDGEVFRFYGSYSSRSLALDFLRHTYALINISACGILPPPRKVF